MEYLGLAIGLALLLSPFLLLFFAYRYFRARRRYRRAEAALRRTAPGPIGRSVPALTATPPRAPIAWPDGEYRFVALDVETASAWPGSICQIGIACVGDDGTIETFATYIDPQCAFDPANVAIHGISDVHVRGAPTFEDVLPGIAPLLSRHTIVQHSSFDRSAIRAACAAAGMPDPQWRWIDSVRIARSAWPELRGKGGHGLANLSKVLGIEMIHHDAGHDAKAAARVVLRAEERTGVAFDAIVPRVRFTPRTKIELPEPASHGRHVGQVIVFTGDLSISRDEAMTLAARNGMTVRNNVSRKTTIVVASLPHLDTGKMKKANAYISAGLPIRILTEREFMALVAEPRLRAPRTP